MPEIGCFSGGWLTVFYYSLVKVQLGYRWAEELCTSSLL